MFQFYLNNMINYRHLYPQNGDRIVTIDSVTSLRPVYCACWYAAAMRSRVYATVVGPSIRPLVCLSHPYAAAAGFLLRFCCRVSSGQDRCCTVCSRRAAAASGARMLWILGMGDTRNFIHDIYRGKYRDAGISRYWFCDSNYQIKGIVIVILKAEIVWFMRDPSSLHEMNLVFHFGLLCTNYLHVVFQQTKLNTELSDSLRYEMLL